MLLGRLLEENIGPGVDEEVQADGIGPLARASDAIGLLDCFAELSLRRTAVLEGAAPRSAGDRELHRASARVRRIAISASKTDGEGEVRGTDDQAQDVEGPGARELLAVVIAVGMGDRPTGGRDRLCAACGNRLGAARIPDIEEDERRPGNMQRAEVAGLASPIVHCCSSPQFACWVDCQWAGSSWLRSVHRSSGKKMRAPSSSTRRLVPGMASASQRAHFTSKYTSSVPHTMSVGAFSFRSRASMASVCLLSKAARKRWKSRGRCSVRTSGRRYVSMLSSVNRSGCWYAGPRACGER